MLQAVIFDFDGLIIDTETPAYRSWQEIYHEHNVELSLAAWSLCLGGAGAEFDPCEHLSRLTTRSVDSDALLARRNARKLELVALQPLCEGVEDRLREAKELGLKLAVASSSGTTRVTEHLEQRGIHAYFDAVVGGDQVPRAKPHPDLYITALSRLNVMSSDALALEDSPNGVRAARAAGVFCVVVKNALTKHLPFEDVDHEVDSLSSLRFTDWCTEALQIKGVL